MIIQAGTLLQAAVVGAQALPVGVEALNDMVVAGHSGWTTVEVVDFLQAQLDSAVPTFTVLLQQEPLASALAPMPDLGSCPQHAIADKSA